jgi:hypothetical protein
MPSTLIGSNRCGLLRTRCRLIHAAPKRVFRPYLPDYLLVSFAYFFCVTYETARIERCAGEETRTAGYPGAQTVSALGCSCLKE